MWILILSTHLIFFFFDFIQYDYSCGTFSPDGRIFQLEYATKAVENSGYVTRMGAIDDCNCFELHGDKFLMYTFYFRTSIGIRCCDGIVMAVEKVSKSSFSNRSMHK